jgi:hypothetical protein
VSRLQVKGAQVDMWFQGRTTHDLKAVQAMTDDQVDTLERHANNAYHHGYREGRRQYMTWNRRLQWLAMLTASLMMAMASGLLMVKLLEAPPPITMAEAGAADEWRIHHEAEDGMYIWVREPSPGIHCFRESGNRTYSSDGHDDSLGCVVYPGLAP